MAPVGLLLRTVFESILEVFLLCLAGYILARKGILAKKTQKQLNHLNVSLFTPALLFSKVAFTLSPAKLSELWIIPIFFVVVTVISMFVAYVLGVLFRLKRSQRNFAMAASMFMNSNSLPVALMQSLVITVPGLAWGPDDTVDAMLGRALSYLVLFSTLGMVLRWSYGVHILSQADPESREERHIGVPCDEVDETLARVGESSPLLANRVHSVPKSLSSYQSPQSSKRSSISVDQNADTTCEPNSIRNRNGIVFFSFPNTPRGSAYNLPSSGSSSTLGPDNDQHYADEPESDELPEAGFGRQYTSPTSSRLQSRIRRCWHRVKKGLQVVNKFMTAPLWASLLSIIVALIPPLQHLLDVHVQPFKGAISSAGNCSIPITLVVLGAYFYTPPDEKLSKGNVLSSSSTGERGAVTSESSRDPSFVLSIRSMVRLSRLDRIMVKKPKNDPRRGEMRTVIIAILSRMLITPLLLLPLLALSGVYSIPSVFDDPVFVVSTILLMSSPPALTLAQITQAAVGDAFERLISQTIFWSYCVVTPVAAIIYTLIGLLIAEQ